MLKWMNRNSLKLSFIPLLRRFKALDGVVDEVYDNLGSLADSINEGKFSYNPTTKFLEVGSFLDSEDNVEGGNSNGE